MNKKYGIIEKKVFDQTASGLIELFGLPEIQRKLSVYTYDLEGNQLHVNFIDQRCDIKYIPTKNKNTTPPIFVENKNLKQLFDTVNSLGFTKADIGFVLSLNFKVNDGFKVSLSQETFADNLAEVRFDNKNKDNLEKVEILFNKLNIKVIDRETLKNYLDRKILVKRDLFDKFGCIDSKIKKYSEIVGIDILSNTRSLRSRIKKFSNDYSIYENWFTKITKGELNGTRPLSKIDKFFKPMSIIIPSFNSNNSIIKTLYSIESQALSKEDKQKVQVVVIDDGSQIPVYETIRSHLFKFSFDLKVIRLEKNSGLSTARNVGILSSKYEHIILIDSDILLPKNYLFEHSVRNQMIPHAVFVSLKKNIDPQSEFCEVNNITKGLESPTSIDDLRLTKNIERDQPSVHEFNESATVEILNDTDYFKGFGYGRTIGIFDLPSMVIGHNLSTRRKTLDKCKYFSNNFEGWGMEDSYMGAKIVANGNFVIPVLSTNVYHLNHEPRSGSEKKKISELKHNIKIYNKLLDQDFD